MSKYTDDLIRFIKRHGCEDTDNYGQIVIYTGLMYDEDGNIVPCIMPLEDEQR